MREIRRGELRHHRKGRVRGLVARRAARHDLGRWGEWIVLRHVLGLGWDVLARNWTGRNGEVDLIAYDGPDLVFVEVKTRRGSGPIAPEDQVDVAKEEQLEKLAMEFQWRYELTDLPVRIDIVAVETPDFREFEIFHYVT